MDSLTGLLQLYRLYGSKLTLQWFDSDYLKVQMIATRQVIATEDVAAREKYLSQNQV